MRNNALPYPMYGLAWTIAYPFLDADGDSVTGATTPDAEVSKNGDTFADCTNESTEIATASGVYYLTLTATEMTADIVVVQGKSATAGMKTTFAVLYPRKLVQFKASATSAAGAAGTITFDSGASTIDDFYNGMVIVATLDGAVETRIITDYVGSTKVASVTPNWNTTPDSDDTFIVYLTPEMSMYAKADVLAWNSAAIASPHTAGYPVVTVKDGTGTGEIDTTSGGVLVAAIANNAITAASINADAITDAKVAADVTIASVTGAVGSVTGNVGGNVSGNVTGTIGGLTAAALKDFFDTDSATTYASAVAGSVVKEIADNAGGAALTEAGIAAAVWDLDATGHQTQGTFGQAIGDPAADTNTIYKAVVTDAAGANVAADIVAVKAETASILDDTDDIGVAGAGLTAINLPDQTMNITGDITGNLSGSVGSVTGAVGSVAAGGIAAASFAANAITAAKLDPDVTTELQSGLATSASIAALNNISTAQVNAEVVDALATDTYAEPGQGAPSATTTLAAKINYLYKAWRNKTTQTSSQYSLYADDASTIDQKAAVTDDSTTMTRGEVATGP
jgi:hypothetical protein